MKNKNGIFIKKQDRPNSFSLRKHCFLFSDKDAPKVMVFSKKSAFCSKQMRNTIEKPSDFRLVCHCLIVL